MIVPSFSKVKRLGTLILLHFRSFKVGCKAFIRLGLKQQNTGEYVLEVKSSNLDHNNHPVTAEVRDSAEH